VPELGIPPWSDVTDVIRHEVIPVLIILVAAFLALRLGEIFIRGIVGALFDREATEGTAQGLSTVEIEKRKHTIDGMLQNTFRFFIVVIAGLMVLGQIGIDIGPAVAGLGVVGIAVGFGAQSMVRDYLNGALILVENQFAKGDLVRIGGVEGTVEDFTLRRTTVRDDEGIVHTVPNGEIKVASNLSRGGPSS
jgi:moderate conductance mechanosensitive channel